VVSTIEHGLVRLDVGDDEVDFEMFYNLDKARLPIQYLANLFSGGNEDLIRNILRKMLAVRILKRRQSVEGEVDEQTERILAFAGTDLEEAEAMYRLTTIPTLKDRFVLPPYHREMAIEAWEDPLDHKGETGLGYVQIPIRGA
jgi:nitrate reductase beta subunit